jgi:hypothetical protein
MKDIKRVLKERYGSTPSWVRSLLKVLAASTAALVALTAVFKLISELPF